VVRVRSGRRHGRRRDRCRRVRVGGDRSRGGWFRRDGGGRDRLRGYRSRGHRLRGNGGRGHRGRRVRVSRRRLDRGRSRLDDANVVDADGVLSRIAALTVGVGHATKRRNRRAGWRRTQRRSRNRAGRRSRNRAGRRRRNTDIALTDIVAIAVGIGLTANLKFGAIANWRSSDDSSISYDRKGRNRGEMHWILLKR
jgi:hypothetical protein